MSKIESHHVDWVASGGIEELVGSVQESLPVEESWGVFLLVANQVFSHNNHTYTCRSEILLSTSIDDTIFFPVNGSGTDV